VRKTLATYGRGRLAIGLALAHAIIFLLIVFSEAPLPPCPDPTGAVCDMGDMDLTGAISVLVMGRDLHYNLAFTQLRLYDLPALLVGTGLGIALHLTGIRLSPVPESYVFGWSMLVLGTVQWWLVGVLATPRRRAKNAPKDQER
jgi:hypothetical protein